MENSNTFLLQDVVTKETKEINSLLDLKFFLNTLKDNDLSNLKLTISTKKKSNSKKKGNGEGTLYYSETLKKWIGQFWNGNKRVTLTQKKNETVKSFKDRYYKSKQEAEDGVYIEKSKESISSLAKAYIEQKRLDEDVSPRSYRRKLNTLKQIEKTCNNFCYIPIQNVTIKHIEKAKEKIKEYSNSEIDKMWQLLKKVFSIACSPSRKILIYNLMQDENLKKPISKKKTKKVKPLTVKEFQRLNEILDNEERNHKYRNIVKMQGISGMRIGEVLARSINDYDPKKQLFNVHNTLTQDENYHVIWSEHTKNYNKATQEDEGQRYLPLNTKSELFNSLVTIIKEQQNKKINNVRNLLFWDYEKNDFVSPNNVNNWLKRLNTKYKICNEELTTHRLRHTAITNWAKLGIPLKVIQYFAGHVKGSSVTEKTYIDISLEFSTEILNKLSKSA